MLRVTIAFPIRKCRSNRPTCFTPTLCYIGAKMPAFDDWRRIARRALVVVRDRVAPDRRRRELEHAHAGRRIRGRESGSRDRSRGRALLVACGRPQTLEGPRELTEE